MSDIEKIKQILYMGIGRSKLEDEGELSIML